MYTEIDVLDNLSITVHEQYNFTYTYIMYISYSFIMHMYCILYYNMFTYIVAT